MNEEIMNREEIIEATEEIVKADSNNKYVLGATIGVGIIATTVICKRFLMPKARKVMENLKRKKEDESVVEYADLKFEDYDEEEEE